MPQKLALVMISNFGRADGDRETWAYQFLPRLLARNPGLSTHLYALRVAGQPDNSTELESAVAPGDRPRLRQRFFRAARNWIPNSLKMVWAMFRHDICWDNVAFRQGTVRESGFALAPPRG